MRTRRQFRPTIDFMPSRIVPSDLGVVADPSDLSANPTDGSTTITYPMDPTAIPTSGPTTVDPTQAGPGSYNSPSTLPTSPLLC